MTQLTLKRPLVNLWTAVTALDRSPDEVRALIENGRLSYAWDIASKTSKHREIRILAESLGEFQSGRPSRPLAADAEFQRILKIIFPAVSCSANGVRRTVFATTISKRFSSSHSLIHMLADEGSLRFAKGAVRRRGPGGSPAITWDSVVAFLRERRIV